MNARAVLHGGLGAARFILMTLYFVLLVPVLYFGTAAYSDYRNLGCPGAWQCGDASLIVEIAVLYVLAAPMIWFGFKLLQKRRRVSRGAVDA
jgi:hypothetical protein